MTELEHFIRTHRDWSDLLTEAPYNLTINSDGNYYIFKYKQGISDVFNPIVKEARGIIFYIEGDYIECVCHPFNRFYNYGDPAAADIDWKHPVTVTEKVDGSLMKVWHHGGKWHISTNGTIDARKANLDSLKFSNYYELFQEAFRETLAMKGYNIYYPLSNDYYASAEDFFDEVGAKNFTYMFELVSPYNRVVIPYESAYLYFLGFRNKATDREYNIEGSLVYDYFMTPATFAMNDTISVRCAADALSWDKEGYVVCDSNFNRIKVKSPEYVKAHYLRQNNNITKEDLLKVILAGEEEEFLIYCKDYRDDLKLMQNLLEAARDGYTQAFRYIGSLYNIDDRKEFACAIKKTYCNAKLPYLFHMYNAYVAGVPIDECFDTMWHLLESQSKFKAMLSLLGYG